MLSVSIVVPTLNEEDFLPALLDSVAAQTVPPLETIVIDGGSSDATRQVATRRGCVWLEEKGLAEFPSRDRGASVAKGDILLFTGADCVLGPETLSRFVQTFESNPGLLAAAGPGQPFDGPPWARIEYWGYNWARALAMRLPRRWQRFSTSTNCLAVSADSFRRVGGFGRQDINADGEMGRRLQQLGPVYFGRDLAIGMSGRRAAAMGFLRFNLHFLYVLGNFSSRVAGSRWLARARRRSDAKHGEIHNPGPVARKP